MPELEADFIISNNNALEAEYSIDESQHFDCSFELFAAGTVWGSIDGNIENQTDLIEALNQKADISSLEALSQTVDNNYNSLDSKIDSTQTTLENEITSLEADLNGKIDDTDTNLAELSQTVSDNKTSTDNTINTLSDTVSDNYTDLNNKISSNAQNITSIQNTINDYGDIVTYNASSFATNLQGQKADTALQPNDDITKLNNNAGYITSADVPTVNNSTITFQKNNVTVGDINLNQPNNKTINIDVPTTASDVNALPDTTTINDLTTTAQQNAINSGATSDNIGQIATNTSNLNSLQTTVTNNYNTLDGRITSEVSALNSAITAEATNRQNADNNLQSQIDAIVSSSDVFDIVGTYAELEAYDISTVPVNDIIKVLVDSTHSNAATYYRCIETAGVKSWSYIGSEGAYYTKSESDNLFVEQTTTINGQDLSNNITLTATDVGALPSSTVIGSGTLTIQNNGVDVDTFSANATNNKSINIVTPTKTSDLVNDSGFIDNADLSDFVTQTDLISGLATKQDTISDLSTVRQNAQNGQSAYTTIDGYGDIVTYNASNFATSAQGSLADTALQQGDDISLLNNDAGYITGIGSSDVISALGYTPYNSTNPAGYTSNVGTVTSVNNIEPVNGNVTLSIPDTSNLANKDLSNLSIAGNSKFQAPLVSGTNIKTVNNESILGSGNISINGIENTATGTSSLTLLGTPSTANSSINIGVNSEATSADSVAIGVRAKANSNFATAIGYGAEVTASYGIQLGYGTNSSNDFHVGFYNAFTAVTKNYKLLYFSTGKIPDDRLNNYKFDGQWVQKTLEISTATSVASRTHSLSDYLPSDSYSYEVFFSLIGNSNSSSLARLAVGTVPSPYDNICLKGSVRCNTNSRTDSNAVILPVGTDRNIYSQINGAAFSATANIYAYGYRRIGTNS